MSKYTFTESNYEQHMQSIKAAIPSKNIIAPRSTINLANGRTNPSNYTH